MTHCLSETRSYVFVAKVTKLSHKKCMIWHSLINVSKIQLLSCFCYKFHSSVMTSQIPFSMHVLFLSVSKINESRGSWLLMSLSHSPWERSPNCAPKHHVLWPLLTQCQFTWTCTGMISKEVDGSGPGFSAMSTIMKKINRSSVSSIFCLLTLTSGSQTSQKINTETSMRETCHLRRFPVLYEEFCLLKRKEKNSLSYPCFLCLTTTSTKQFWGKFWNKPILGLYVCS